MLFSSIDSRRDRKESLTHGVRVGASHSPISLKARVTKKEALGFDVERRDVMKEKTEAIGSVVVLEEGAEFLKWVAEYQRHATNSIVVAYSPGESSADFAARFARRLSESKGELCVGIVACGPRTDTQHLAARESIARTLLTAIEARGRGEVLLAAAVESSEDAKFAIFELAGVLCEGLHDSRCVVRVRFSSGRPESGIMPSVASPIESDHAAYRSIAGSRR